MRHVLRIGRLGVGVLLAAGVALAQKPAESKPPASAAPQAQVAKPAPPAQAVKPAAPGKTVGAPKIEIGQETRDMGTVPKGQVIETDFVFKNSGGSDLIISDARPSCGCTVSSFDKVVKPGAEGKIHTSVDTKSFSGPISKSVLVVSNDPEFETKAADVIGLYLNPPTHAAVFCVDEKTAIQALDRKDRMLPLAPGRAESHGFEYKRNGTLSLFAALNTATGEVIGKTAPRHTSAQFVAFLTDVVSSQTKCREIHVICDNVSSHKTDAVKMFLDAHKRVTIHYTPTYSSWLNQVENWFARIQRDVITRGVFSSLKDLDKKLMGYIRQYNKNAFPLKWKYNNPQRRIRCDSSGSVD